MIVQESTRANVTPMSERVAGQSVIEKLLTAQDSLPPASRIARFFGASAIRPQNLNWHTSAVGERMLGETLRRLPSEWRVFHSVPVGLGNADIDHILIGPAGIFTINTKHHAGATIWVAGGRMLVNGSTQAKYVPEAEAEARRLERTLSGRLLTDPTVRPVIAFVGAKKLTVRNPSEDVAVMEASSLVRWLTQQPTVLSADCQDYLAAVVDDPSTWRLTKAVDRDELLRRFAELSVLGRQAKFVQSLWGLVGLLVGVGVATTLTTIAVNWMQ